MPRSEARVRDARLATCSTRSAASSDAVVRSATRASSAAPPSWVAIATGSRTPPTTRATPQPTQAQTISDPRRRRGMANAAATMTTPKMLVKRCGSSPTAAVTTETTTRATVAPTTAGVTDRCASSRPCCSSPVTAAPSWNAAEGGSAGARRGSARCWPQRPPAAARRGTWRNRPAAHRARSSTSIVTVSPTSRTVSPSSAANVPRRSISTARRASSRSTTTTGRPRTWSLEPGAAHRHRQQLDQIDRFWPRIDLADPDAREVEQRLERPREVRRLPRQATEHLVPLLGGHPFGVRARASARRRGPPSADRGGPPTPGRRSPPGGHRARAAGRAGRPGSPPPARGPGPRRGARRAPPRPRRPPSAGRRRRGHRPSARRCRARRRGSGWRPPRRGRGPGGGARRCGSRARSPSGRSPGRDR